MTALLERRRVLRFANALGVYRERVVRVAWDVQGRARRVREARA